MNTEQFLDEIKNILQIQDTLTPQTYLFDLDEWDSLAMMNIVAFFTQKLNKKITVTELQKIDTVEQLIKLAF